MTQSYNYQDRAGVEPVSWSRFEELTRELALRVVPYAPEIILGIARGGLFPAVMLSFLLRREMYPIRLSRRHDDRVVRERPEWLVPPPDVMAERRVLIVDEIASSGETLWIAAEAVRGMGAAEVRTAALYAHSWADPEPDYVVMVSDALIINPWDRWILENGKIVPHPEYVDALSAQGLSADLLQGRQP